MSMVLRWVFWGWALGLCLWLPVQAAEAPVAEAVPLTYNQRVIHQFRAQLGPYTPKERAEAALRRLKDALGQPGGEGWVLVRSGPSGHQVELDGRPLFLVMPGDANELAGESAEALAHQSARVLRTVWKEAQEKLDTRAIAIGVAHALASGLGFLLGATLLMRGSRRLREVLTRRMQGQLKARHLDKVLPRVLAVFPSLLNQMLTVLVWLAVLVLFVLCLTYALGQFAVTRATSEALSQSILTLVSEVLLAALQALPELLLAVLIFIVAWIVTRVSADYFSSFEFSASDRGLLNVHTAPVTRRLVNALVWLFALAMAYPYLPGSDTEAFKGLSVFIGLMVSIGASGVVGQIASGVMIVYTLPIKKGEYVRIQDYEGTVTDVGMFVTRLRTGMGEEVSLPNAYVLGNVIRNYSRVNGGKGYVLDTEVTIGYDVPWRQVHAMLLEAVGDVGLILSDPKPYVVQTALSDFYVHYRLVVYVNSEVPSVRAQVASQLNAAIQDSFNRYGVQIMSPHYLGDPPEAKIVPPGKWYPAPAKEEMAVVARPAG